ncbi:MAG: beta-propeller domain-containing protein [Planctomycetota bacterium]|nr:MAG: beta-propeller domain-containing protein [Planctomycetota bacterium]
MRRIWILGLVSVCLAVSGAACPLLPIDPPPRVAGMKVFSSPEELRSYLVEQASAQYLRSQSEEPMLPFFFGLGLPMPASTPSAQPMPDMSGQLAEGGDADGDRGFSTTNIQEIGVDECDVVKNDGQIIYVLDGSTIHIVSATPAEDLLEVTPIQLESYGDSLYLYQNKLVVLSQKYAYYETQWDFVLSAQQTDLVGGTWNDGSETSVTIIDVTDPENTTIIKTIKLEGSLASSRMIDNKLYLILTTIPRLPIDLTSDTLESMGLDEWIPDYQIAQADGSIASGDIIEWDNFYRPEEPNGYGITTVVTLDVDTPDTDFQSIAVTADAGTIYASTDSLYVTDTEYGIVGSTYRQDTIIHKFNFTEGGTEYIASGIVPGRPLNQYSLGEHEDYLRIATTGGLNSFLNQNGQANNVYVLGEADTSLDIVGKIENIAPGETIYAARFIGDRGFLVTFKKIDPLFTLDLADPKQPKLMGELKVPGYSDHIQLLDDNHLLTIGKDAEDVGSFAWFQGVQLSIFDVTDFAKPRLLHKEIIGSRGTNSEANENPKAFNYYAPLGALAFPIDLYQGDTTGPTYGQHTFTGLYVYDVSVENGFKLLGRIATTDGETNNGCFRSYYGFTRGVFIDDKIYSVSQVGVKASSIDDVETLIGQTAFADTSSIVEDCYDYPTVVNISTGGDVR